MSPGHSIPNHLERQAWHQVSGIPGLWLCCNFLEETRQEELLRDILAEGWFESPANNQAMRFGDLPTWAEKLGSGIHQAAVHFAGSVPVETPDSETPLPPDLLWREPPFDQMIVNSYQPGEGITSHVDLARFEDGIAIVSLGREEMMEFRPVDCEPPVEEPGAKRSRREGAHEGRQQKRRNHCESSNDTRLREGDDSCQADERPCTGPQPMISDPGCECATGLQNDRDTLGSDAASRRGGSHTEKDTVQKQGLDGSELEDAITGDEAQRADAKTGESLCAAGLQNEDDAGRTLKSASTRLEARENELLSCENGRFPGSQAEVALYSVDCNLLCVGNLDAKVNASGVRQLMLPPGSLLLLSGEARYKWEHGIPGRTHQSERSGSSSGGKVRISVTLRRLCRTS